MIDGRSDRRLRADPQAPDLPLDAHLHTDRSTDSDVPIDDYGAAAVARGIAELAITDHIDFDPRAGRDYATVERARAARPGRGRALGAARGHDPLRARGDVRPTRRTRSESISAGHPYDFVIGSVHITRDSPYHVSRVERWVAGRSIDEIVAPYFDEVEAAARSGLFDTLGHLDFVKRYVGPHVSRRRSPAARPVRADPPGAGRVGHGPRGEHERAAPGRRARPTRVRPSSPGSASSAAERLTRWFGRAPAGLVRSRSCGWLRIAAEAGFEALAFRRGSERVAIPLPARFGRE